MNVSYRPTDLLVLDELDDDELNISAIERVRRKYDKYLYFVVSLSHQGTEIASGQLDADQYDDLIRTMSFRMSGAINVTNSDSTELPVAEILLDRTYGLAKSTNLLMALEKTDVDMRSDWVEILIKEFGAGIGDRRFRFRISDLKSVPEIL